MAGEKRTLAQDFADLLRAFIAHEVRFLLVGAYALAVHGRPRATGDLDIWVEPTAANARRVLSALRAFGAPLGDLREEDLNTPGVVFQIGIAPVRVDILTSATGIDFEGAWRRRVEAAFGDVRVPVISRADLIANKRAVGRTRDLADVESLEQG
jgi:hypothetical protein